MRFINFLSLVHVASALAFGLSTQVSAADVAADQGRRALMANVKTWGYQLQKLDPSALASSPFDLVVIDHAPDRVESLELLFRRAEVEALKVKPDGSRRVVLAYMSIGEAEWYRFYWDPDWQHKTNCPAWLGAANPQWAGNYPVRYWQPGWQALIYGKSDSYVDRVMAAGFDGIYLDRADVYYEFKDRASAREDMIGFISALTDHARTLNSQAIVVLQNAEELLAHKGLRTKLDGVAKESLYFNADKAGAPVANQERMAAAAALRAMKRAGGKVMVVEYVDAAYKAAEARKLAQSDGFLIHFTERSLSTLSLTGPDETPRLAAIGGQPVTSGGGQTDPFVPPNPCS